MALSTFSIIVAVDMGNGIAKNGEIPWHSSEDSRFFRETTLGKKKNAVIMGRVTYESIPEKHRPLEGRHNIVISRTWKQEEHPEIGIFSSLGDALAGLGSNMKSYDEVFVMGGEQIYAEAIRDYMYLCKKIYVTRFKTDYDCDQFFPVDKVSHYPVFQSETKSRDYVRYFYAPRVVHDEQQYLDVIERVKKEGESKPDRTGVGTTSLFGDVHMVFDISERVPFITTKKLFYDSVIKELLFFVSGKTNTKILEDQSVKIWKDNTSRAFLDGRGLKHFEEGDMGKGYGWQYRHWGAEYDGCDKKYDGKGYDQLAAVIESIKTDPHSRRHVITAWNPADMKEIALAPCHILFQFNVSADRKWLDCKILLRSNDFFHGAPFNIASYAILTYMVAHVTGLRPRRLYYDVGDAHIYNSHKEQLERQIRRTPKPFPRLSFRNSTRIHTIDDFTFDSFIVEGYTSWPAIQASMAV